MSAVNRDRRHRKDLSSPSKSSELSFMKRAHTRRNSSSASKVSSESSSFHHTCNPLPQWLVNTFRTLSKKNPLRRLLPPDASEGSGVLHTQTETTAQPIDLSAPGPSFAFDLPDLDRVQAQKKEYLFALPQTTLIADDDQENWPKPLPFSTPGPASLLGSSVASNTAFSLPIPQKYLSLVSYYADETHIGSDLPSNGSHTPVYYSDSDPSDPGISYNACFETFATDKVNSSWNPSVSEEDCPSLFSNIYSTPGPLYCAPRPVHFDSPLKDPMIPDHSRLGYEIDYDAIDFHWKPFDRKNLVIPDRFQKPIYVSGHARSNGASNTSEYEPAVKPIHETNTLNLHTSPRPPSPLPSISPAPFRFLLPPETDVMIAVPESKVQNSIQKPSTPKNSPYFAVPGIYISPLDEYRKVNDSAIAKKHGVEQANSQASADSIESWEENLF
ncbi:hypothetical protein BYT27DRAFT_7246471 [Phlegmacium glaucopus]|nr:hypothetical protein BYT27DRAFT_7246471 [Phlegmacium glaucopus]